MDTRSSLEVKRTEIMKNIKTLSIEFSNLRPKAERALPEIWATKNPKEVLLKMIKVFGFNPKHFQVRFVKNDNSYQGEVSFAERQPISLSNRVKLTFTIKNRKIEDETKKKHFIFAVAHELCHVLLLSSSHRLGESELCTDLLALIIGFNVVHYPFNFVNSKSAFYGYITINDLKWIHQEVVRKSEIIYLQKN